MITAVTLTKDASLGAHIDTWQVECVLASLAPVSFQINAGCRDEAHALIRGIGDMLGHCAMVFPVDGGSRVVLRGNDFQIGYKCENQSVDLTLKSLDTIGFALSQNDIVDLEPIEYFRTPSFELENT